MGAQRSVWDAVFGYLRQAGTEIVFGLPHDDLGALHGLKRCGLRLVLCRDQRNAVFMAAGYALTRDHLGVCIVGKGPALSNATTGLLESASLSAPVLLIGVGTAGARTGTRAFQECDQLALVRPLVKWAYRVEHPDRLLWAMQRAAFLSLNGNPGPVYLEIPDDLAAPTEPWPDCREPLPILRPIPADAEIGAAIALLQRARRPLFVLGGGAKRHAANADFARLAERIGAAVFTTASGRGAFLEQHPLFCGLAGLYTAKPLRTLWTEADLIVVFGSRMEETAMLLLDPPSPRQGIVQIDIDVDNFSHTHPTLKVLGDAAAAATALAARLASDPAADTEWTLQIGALKRVAAEQRVALQGPTQHTAIGVADVLAALEEVLPADSVIAQENGLLDMWSYLFPYFSLQAGQGSIVPSEQTTLGFGASAALGAKLARPDSMVVAFIGDGALNMHWPDLFTGADHFAPVTYLVLDNESFGWLAYQARCQSSDTAPFRFSRALVASHPRFATLPVTTREQIRDALVQARRFNADGTSVMIHTRILDMQPAPGIEDFYGSGQQCTARETCESTVISAN